MLHAFVIATRILICRLMLKIETAFIREFLLRYYPLTEDPSPLFVHANSRQYVNKSLFSCYGICEVAIGWLGSFVSSTFRFMIVSFVDT